ncbi:hypothetical protein GCM10011533_20610 [Streptosporangium jomthongense]|uniref:TonB family protein n=1 Tax=Marinobacter aromaticivorans TaxID=1494078 RepID=A0ABW2IWA4_9GAMM|nr:TonB family protein [Marinobacter aromaticivorans]GGE68143.1 hypothetical protein GCM10011533_20610 [Streptosporangium jomthongense]
MLEHGSNNSLPAKYRIALALSTALLIHTLLLSGIPSLVQDAPVRHREQLTLELVATTTTQATPAPDSSRQNPEPDPATNAVPDNSNPEPIKPDILASQSQQKTGHQDFKTRENARASEQTEKTGPAEAALASPASSSPPVSGARGQVAEKENTGELTRITQSSSEQDPYLAKLAIHLANQLDAQRIPAIRDLRDSSTMELELQLLSNGALTRVRVIRSTGIAQIDRAAYRAALAASPYPQPPPGKPDNSHFEVKLVFAPSRL